MRTLLLVALMGCGPKADLSNIDPEAPPVLPAPEARLYATGPAEPADPIVAAVVSQAGLPWQESLAGAATYLALNEPFVPELALARWGAIRAGYPHPVRAVTFGASARNTFPEALVEELSRVVQPGEDIGLVRARTGSDDRWIALIGTPSLPLQPTAREYAPGEKLELAGEGTWRLQAPDGELTEGSMPAELMLSRIGEWWLELRWRPGGAPAVSVPLYVGMRTPPAPVLALPGDKVDAPSAALDLAYASVSQLRDAFDLPALLDDETLEVLAEYPLKQGIDGVIDPEKGVSRLRSAGFVGGPAGQVYCEGRTVALCLDSLMWNIDSRKHLLSPGLRLIGGAAEVRTSGVALLLNVASE